MTINEPRQWQAKDIEGKLVQGWYAVLHIPDTDRHDKLVGYKRVPSIFNDEPSNRNGSYWHTIDPSTLRLAPSVGNLFNTENNGQ